MMTINREDEWKIEGLEVTAPLDSDLYLSLEPLVVQAASKEWANSHIYELDDVVQAVWLHAMENWKEYEKAETGLRFSMARRAARGFCAKQRVDYMYATGAFLYTPGMVRRLLDTQVYCDPENAADLEARADISEAITYLTRGQKAILYKKFALKEQLLTSAEKSHEFRAITAITHRLNTGLRLHAEGY